MYSWIHSFDLVEFFAGKAAVSRVFKEGGHQVASYDSELGEGMDFLSPGGYAFLACRAM